MKLHIGSGPAAMKDWINIDLKPYPGVDHVVDVSAGLPYTEVDLIFAEHFLEHLPLHKGFQFLVDCRKALKDKGILRIATPNLDWIWLTHYRHPADMTEEEALFGCLEMNRAFHGWGHRFSYNGTMLRSLLQSAGFAEVLFCRYGESRNPALRGLEQHPRNPDHPEAPHILIAEASGKGHPTALAELMIPYLRDLEVD